MNTFTEGVLFLVPDLNPEQRGTEVEKDLRPMVQRGDRFFAIGNAFVCSPVMRLAAMQP